MLLFALIIPLVLAQTIPQNIQKAYEDTLKEAEKITYLTAFLGGVMMLFAPCTIGIAPAYFAITFSEKRKLVFMTFVFFLGFAFVFSLLGLTASLVGSFLNLYRNQLIFISGLLLIILGFMTVFGKGFSSPIKARQKEIKSIPQVFVYGMLFAIGFSACVGPILAGILLLASVLSPTKALLLMFFYSIGYAIPFMGLSYFFDKVKITEMKIFKKNIQLDFSSKKVTLYLTNIVGGLLFIGLGILFITLKGTSIFNITTPLTFLDYEIQRRLINLNIPMSNIILIVLLALVGIFVWRNYRGSSNDKKASQ